MCQYGYRSAHIHASSGSVTIEGVNFINAAIVGEKDFQAQSEPHLVQIQMDNE